MQVEEDGAHRWQYKERDEKNSTLMLWMDPVLWLQVVVIGRVDGKVCFHNFSFVLSDLNFHPFPSQFSDVISPDKKRGRDDDSDSENDVDELGRVCVKCSFTLTNIS